jgi:hypothetical protein
LRRDQSINKVEKREKPASRKVEKGKLKQTHHSKVIDGEGVFCFGAEEFQNWT